MIYLRAGSSLLIEAKVSDEVLSILTSINPDSITITIKDLDNIIVVNNIAMSSTSVIGYYTYLYRSAIFNTNGAYIASIRATLGTQIVVLKEFVAFVVVDSIVDSNGAIVQLPDHFDYLILRATNGVYWYWSIVSSSIDASDAQYILTDTIPTDPYLAAHDITPTIIPNAIKVLDELGNPVYIYPDTLGQVVVDSNIPSGVIYDVGSSLHMIGRDRVTYSYTGLSFLSAMLSPIAYPSI